MVNLISLQYFIPELVLSLIAFFLFITDEIASPQIRRLNHWIICSGIIISLMATIYFLYDPPHAIFSNFFKTSPTRNIFKFMLLLASLLFYITEFLRPIPNPGASDSSNLFQKMVIILGAVLVLTANNLIALLLAIGLIGAATISLIFSFSRLPLTERVIQKHILNILLNFAIFLSAFCLMFALSGSLSLEVIPQKLLIYNDEPLILSILMLIIIASFGLALGIFPFQFTQFKISNILPGSLGLFVLFIPAIAYTGIFMEMRNLVINSPDRIFTIIVIFSLLTCLVGNIRLYNNKSLKKLIANILVVHSGLILLGIAVNNRFSLLSVIYLTFSTIITISGIYSCKKLLPVRSKLGYGLIAIFMLSLMGFPGTSGFAARFLLMKALTQFPLHYTLVLLALLNLIPPVFYIVSFMLASRHDILESATSNISIKTLLFPVFHIIAVIIMGVFWEPFIKVIDQALIFL
jgi:NADH:ubiquinone oxidoreductase subunit 2 (subunit N)